VSEINAEDAKIITLARSVRARMGTAEGAAVRDETGRTYAAATVELQSLRLSALQVAVAMAVSSGAEELAAAALVTAADTVSDADVAVVREVGSTAPVLVAGLDGRLRSTVPA
jgi:hypothetical protein